MSVFALGAVDDNGRELDIFRLGPWPAARCNVIRPRGDRSRMASIEARSLRKSFGTVDVLRDINLSVADGEFLVLVGPSGCGKSTLLRIIAGLESVSDGAIMIDGREVTDLPAKARDIAMVF